MTEAGDTTADAAPLVDLEHTVGCLLADVRGLIVGRVECTREVGLRIERRATQVSL